MPVLGYHRLAEGSTTGKPNEYGKLIQLQEAEKQIITHHEIFEQRPSHRRRGMLRRCDLLPPPWVKVQSLSTSCIAH
jgi:hypothetical protein